MLFVFVVVGAFCVVQVKCVDLVAVIPRNTSVTPPQTNKDNHHLLSPVFLADVSHILCLLTVSNSQSRSDAFFPLAAPPLFCSHSSPYDVNPCMKLSEQRFTNDFYHRSEHRTEPRLSLNPAGSGRAP